MAAKMLSLREEPEEDGGGGGTGAGSTLRRRVSPRFNEAKTSSMVPMADKAINHSKKKGFKVITNWKTSKVC